MTTNPLLRQATTLSRQNGPAAPCPWPDRRYWNAEPTKPAKAALIRAEVQHLEGEIRAEVLKAAQAGRFYCTARYSGYFIVIKELQQKESLFGFSLRGKVGKWPACFGGPFIVIEWPETE